MSKQPQHVVQPATSALSIYVLLVICQPQILDQLHDMFGDWKLEGVEIKTVGYTDQEHQGYIVTYWPRPVPQGFQHNQLIEDPEIIDYLIYEL